MAYREIQEVVRSIVKEAQKQGKNIGDIVCEDNAYHLIKTEHFYIVTTKHGEICFPLDDTKIDLLPLTGGFIRWSTPKFVCSYRTHRAVVGIADVIFRKPKKNFGRSNPLRIV